MAEDLNKLIRDLQQVAKSAETATERINRLQEEIKQLLISSAVGGKPVASAVEKTVASLVSGTREVKGGALLGGGAAVNLSALQPAISKLLNEINQLISETKHSSFRMELPQGQATKYNIPFTGTRHLTSIPKKEVIEEVSDEEKNVLFELMKVDRLQKKLSSFGLIDPQIIDKVIENIQKMGLSLDVIKVKIKGVNEEFKKLELNYVKKGVSAREVLFVSKSGELFRDLPKQKPPVRMLEEFLPPLEERPTEKEVLQMFSDAGSKTELLKKKLEETGLLGSEALENIAVVLQRISEYADDVKFKIKSVNEDFTRLDILYSKEGLSGRESLYISKAGEVAKELPKKTLPPIDKQFDEIASKFGTNFADKVKSEIDKSQQAFRDIGIERVFNEVVVSAPKKLADGVTQFTVSIEENAQILDRYKIYLDQLGKAYNQVEYSLRKAYTEPELIESLGLMRTRKALELARRHGFGIESLKDVFTQEPTGVSILKFAMEDAQGVTQKLEVTVDRVGNVLTRTNRRLLGFTDAIIKNTQEVLKWAVGVGMVYGSIYKLQDLVKVAIDNETKLADIAVVLGDAQRDVNQIFDEAAKVATDTGESINSVLETYSLAYRAVGAVENPIERTNVAVQLLTDSTILNKLSTLDAASSIDVLAGSLRQLQKPGEDMADAFARSRDLLDSWVQVSRKANIDLGSLATAFSITSESAENSGVSIEQLNAIIASLAEKIGGLGGRETGNAVRALIGGVYQQQAAEILTKYGIAVQDVSGKMRPFLEISKEIYTLYREGIISADELNKIGYTLGGGVRRGQQYVAFLSDFERIQELVNIQAERGGAAQEALGRKIETTQTSITRLANAFQRLAQTLGTKGGVLDIVNGMLTTFTELVNVLDKIIERLGGLTIPIATLGISGLLFGGEKGAIRSGLMATNMATKIADITTKILSISPKYQQTETMVSPTTGRKVSSIIPSDEAKGIGMTLGIAAGKYLSSTLIASIPGIAKLFSGNVSGGLISIGGAIAGSLISGGNIIGAVIGSVAAEALVEGVKNAKLDLNQIAEDVLYESMRNKDIKLGLEITDVELEKEKVQKELESTVKGVVADIWKREGFPITGVVAATRWGQRVKEAGGFTGLMTEEEKERVRRASARVVPITLGEDVTKVSQIERQRLNLVKEEQAVLNDIIAKSSANLRARAARGDISPREYVEALKTVKALDSSVSKLYIAFGESFDKIDESIEGTTETYQAFSDILLNSSAVQREELIQLASQFIDLTAAIELAKQTGQTMIGDQPVEEVEKTVKDLQAVAAEYSRILRERALIETVKLPTTVNLEDIIDLEGYKAVLDRAKELQKQYFEEAIGEGILSEDAAQALINNAEPIFIQLGNNLGYHLARGITDTSYITKAFEEVRNTISTMGLGFQTFDITRAQMAAIEPRYQEMVQTLTSLGYTLDEQKQIAIFKDGIIEPMSKDWKIVQYLLQEILDTEKKQLDGIYNLPAGAGFYVPYQTLQLAYQKGLNEAMGGGVPKTPVVSAQGKETITDIIKVTTQAVTSQEISRAKLREIQTEGKYDNIIKEAITKFPQKDDFIEPLRKFSQKDELYIPEKETFFDSLKSIFENFYDNFITRGGAGAGLGIGGETLNFKEDFRTLFENLGNKLSTTFNLNLTSTTTLLLDGRVLAEVVKNYMYEDMIRYENTAGAINRTIAI